MLITERLNNLTLGQVAKRNSIFDYTEIMATNNRKLTNKEKNATFTKIPQTLLSVKKYNHVSKNNNSYE